MTILKKILSFSSSKRRRVLTVKYTPAQQWVQDKLTVLRNSYPSHSETLIRSKLQTTLMNVIRGADCLFNNSQHSLVRAILETDGINIHHKDRTGQTALHEAAFYGKLDCVIALIEKGAEINSQDTCGRTPLFYAAERGCIPVLKTLLLSGADPALGTYTNETPLQKAVFYYRKTSVHILSAFSYIQYCLDTDSKTPLDEFMLSFFSTIKMEYDPNYSKSVTLDLCQSIHQLLLNDYSQYHTEITQLLLSIRANNHPLYYVEDSLKHINTFLDNPYQKLQQITQLIDRLTRS